MQAQYNVTKLLVPNAPKKCQSSERNPPYIIGTPAGCSHFAILRICSTLRLYHQRKVPLSLVQVDSFTGSFLTIMLSQYLSESAKSRLRHEAANTFHLDKVQLTVARASSAAQPRKNMIPKDQVLNFSLTRFTIVVV
jgi:hypothetical protein